MGVSKSWDWMDVQGAERGNMLPGRNNRIQLGGRDQSKKCEVKKS